MSQINQIYSHSTTGPMVTSMMEESSTANDEESGWGVDKVAGSDWVFAMYSIICVVGVTGNLLVCIVLLRVPSLRSNTSDFLIHLSLVDLAVCILVIPYKIIPPLMTQTSRPHLPHFLGQLRCKLYVSQYPFWVLVYVSIHTLVTVNVERFVAINLPHKYKRIFGNRRNKVSIIAFCWAFDILFGSFIMFRYTEDPNDGCIFLGWPSFGVQVAFGVLLYVFVLIAPFVFMVTAQWKVISTLKKQVQTLTGQASASDTNRSDKRKMWQLRASQTLMRTMVAFVITFAICLGPNQTWYLLYSFGAKFSFTTPFHHFTVILSIANSCVNPVICIITNQPFRRGIRKAFRCKKNSTRVVDESTLSVSMTTRTT